MNPYESELIAIAKARGDSISRQLVDVLIVKQAEIEHLQNQIEVQGKLLRVYAEKLEEYKEVLTNIANDYPELSHDKARMQNLDHIKWAKEVLK